MAASALAKRGKNTGTGRVTGPAKTELFKGIATTGEVFFCRWHRTSNGKILHHRFCENYFASPFTPKRMAS